MDTKTQFEIRPATAGDVDVLADLIRRAFADVARRFDLTPQNCPKHPSNYTAQWITADLERGVAYTLACCQNQPVGCVGLERPQPESCYLERLAVLPSYRRQGVGRALAEYAITTASDGRARQIGIGIIAAQTDLKKWYLELGFVAGDTKRFAHLPFEVLFMALDLDAGGARRREARF